MCPYSTSVYVYISMNESLFSQSVGIMWLDNGLKMDKFVLGSDR